MCIRDRLWCDLGIHYWPCCVTQTLSIIIMSSKHHSLSQIPKYQQRRILNFIHAIKISHLVLAPLVQNSRQCHVFQSCVFSVSPYLPWLEDVARSHTLIVGHKFKSAAGLQFLSSTELTSLLSYGLPPHQSTRILLIGIFWCRTLEVKQIQRNRFVKEEEEKTALESRGYFNAHIVA